MRRWWAFAPLLIFAALAVALALGLRRDPAILPSALIGKPLPQFTLSEVRPGEGGFSSAELKGKVVLINVYGSWCAGCQIEHPTLMEIKGEAPPIYGFDWKDTPAAGAAWLARNGDPYAHVGGDEDGSVALDLGVTGAPETYVIDKQGRIAYKHVGIITPEIWRGTLAPRIAKLQAEP